MKKMNESEQAEGIGKLSNIVVDVNDLDKCGRFWSRVLGKDILFQDERYLQLGSRGEHPKIMLQKVPELHREKNRVHIDLNVTDLDEAVDRVLALGGRKIRPVREYDFEWVVMADPDGNEFCLIKHSQ